MKRIAPPPQKVSPSAKSAGREHVLLGKGAGTDLGGALANWAQRSVSAAPRVQAKLEIGAPHDAFEQEADEFAAAATNGLEASGFGMVEGGMAAAGAEVVQPKLQEPAGEEEAAVEETRTLRPKLHFSGSSGGGTDAPPNLPEDIGNLRGKGSGLPAHLRGHYERLLGSRLGGVRIHSGAESATLNRQIGARAFTLGQDIFFGQGQYNDASREGQELIAHEVAHTVQQGNGEVVRRKEVEDNLNDRTLPIDLKAAISFNQFAWNRDFLKFLDPFKSYGINPYNRPRAFARLTYELQQDLHQLYAPHFKIDGQFGQNTVETLSAFYRSQIVDISTLPEYDDRPIRQVVSRFRQAFWDYKAQTTFNSSLSELGIFQQISRNRYWLLRWATKGEDHEELLAAMDKAEIFPESYDPSKDSEAQAALIGFQKSNSTISQRNYGTFDFHTALAMDQRMREIEGQAPTLAIPFDVLEPPFAFSSRLAKYVIFENLTKNPDWRLEWPQASKEDQGWRILEPLPFGEKNSYGPELDELGNVLELLEIYSKSYFDFNPSKMAREALVRFQQLDNSIPVRSYGYFDLPTALAMDRRMLLIQNGLPVPAVSSEIHGVVAKLSMVDEIYSIDQRIKRISELHDDRNCAFPDAGVNGVCTNDPPPKQLSIFERPLDELRPEDIEFIPVLMKRRQELLRLYGIQDWERFMLGAQFKASIANELRQYARNMLIANEKGAIAERGRVNQSGPSFANLGQVAVMFATLKEKYQKSDQEFDKGLRYAIVHRQLEADNFRLAACREALAPEFGLEMPDHMNHRCNVKLELSQLKRRYGTYQFKPFTEKPNPYFDKCNQLEAEAFQLLRATTADFNILAYRGLEIRKNIATYATYSTQRIGKLFNDSLDTILSDIEEVKLEDEHIWELGGVIRKWKKDHGVLEGSYIANLIDEQMEEETETSVWTILGEIALGLLALAEGPIGWAAFAAGTALSIKGAIETFDTISNQRAGYGAAIDPEDALSDVEPGWEGFLLTCLVLLPDALDAARYIQKAAAGVRTVAGRGLNRTLKEALIAETKLAGSKFKESLIDDIMKVVMVKDFLFGFVQRFSSSRNVKKLCQLLKREDFQEAIKFVDGLGEGKMDIIARALARGAEENLDSFVKLVDVLKTNPEFFDADFVLLALTSPNLQKSLLEFADRPSVLADAWKEWRSLGEEFTVGFDDFLAARPLPNVKSPSQKLLDEKFADGVEPPSPSIDPIPANNNVPELPTKEFDEFAEGVPQSSSTNDPLPTTEPKVTVHDPSAIPMEANVEPSPSSSTKDLPEAKVVPNPTPIPARTPLQKDLGNINDWIKEHHPKYAQKHVPDTVAQKIVALQSKVSPPLTEIEILNLAYYYASHQKPMSMDKLLAALRTGQHVDPLTGKLVANILASPFADRAIKLVDDLRKASSVQKPVGRFMKDEAVARDVMQKLAKNDPSAWDILGIDMKGGRFDSDKIEWGLAYDPATKEYFVIRGNDPTKSSPGAVDWKDYIGKADILAHSHPYFDHLGAPRKLKFDKGKASLDEILKDGHNQALLLPSPEDLKFMVDFKQGKHTVVTPYRWDPVAKQLVNPDGPSNLPNIVIDIEKPTKLGTSEIFERDVTQAKVRLSANGKPLDADPVTLYLVESPVGPMLSLEKPQLVLQHGPMAPKKPAPSLAPDAVKGVETHRSTIDKIAARVAAQPGKFTQKYSEKEVADLLEKGKQLGLTSKETEDLIFIGQRTHKPINADELAMQMDNYVNVVKASGTPYRFRSPQEFVQFQTELKDQIKGAGFSTSDIRIQGSALRKPTAADLDVAVFIRDAEFDQILVKRFSQRITKDGVKMDLSKMTSPELKQLALDIRANPRSFNSQGDTFANAMLQRSISSKSDISASLKGAKAAIAKAYPHLNIEAISLMTPGGALDLQPFLRIK